MHTINNVWVFCFAIVFRKDSLASIGVAIAIGKIIHFLCRFLSNAIEGDPFRIAICRNVLHSADDL